MRRSPVLQVIASIVVLSLFMTACGIATNPQPTPIAQAETPITTQIAGSTSTAEPVQPQPGGEVLASPTFTPAVISLSYLVCPPASCSIARAWQIGGEQPLELKIPEFGFSHYDASQVSMKVLHASQFPDHGAGPANLSVGDLLVYDIRTQEDQVIFPEQNVVEALWAPNGQDFAYLKATESTYELRWRTATGEDRLLAVDVSPTFSISPDGQQVVFTRETGYKVGTPGVYIVSIDGTGERQIGSSDRQGSGGISDMPLWSPDGKYILLPVSYITAPLRSVLIATDGSGEHPLSYGEGVPSQFTEQEFVPNLWLPDGQHVLGVQFAGMMSPPYGQEAAIGRIDLSSGQITEITPVTWGALTAFAWETPGQRAWLMRDDGSLRLLDFNSPNPIPASCKVAGEQLYVNPTKNYCFSHPKDVNIQAYEYERPLFLGPALEDSIEPLQSRLWVETEDVPQDSQLTDLVDAFIANQPQGEPAITRQPFTLGGEPAELLDYVPGQLFSRVLLSYHNGRLYKLWFNPVDPAVPEVQPEVERLFLTVTGSFAFMP